MLLLLVAASAAAARVELAKGISAELPKGWRRRDQAELDQPHPAQHFKDEETAKRALSERSGEPLLLLSKYPYEHAGLNPIVTVTRLERPAQMKDITPERWAKEIMAALTRMAFASRVEEWEPNVTVGGRPAARGTFTYELRYKAGVALKARGGTVVVMDGDVFYLIATTAAQSGADDTRAEFKALLDSIRFTP